MLRSRSILRPLRSISQQSKTRVSWNKLTRAWQQHIFNILMINNRKHGISRAWNILNIFGCIPFSCEWGPGRSRVSENNTITVLLKRDKRALDFGFSISDRLYGTGVYINKVRSNGPAELEGTLKACMRIYKVISQT